MKNNTIENLKPLQRRESLLMGCDPEFFFVNKKGQVVGSEKVLPKEGLSFGENEYTWYEGVLNEPVFIIDGVQAELNVEPNTCRALLGNDIHACFFQLRQMLKKSGKDLTLKIDPLVNITQNELDSLSDRSKVFGCAPSNNVYQTRQQARIRVNPKKYLKRPAGGHIHFGSDGWQRSLRKALKNPAVMVPILDLVVANTCVLIDRHPGNKERRANYGRCGEYRLKTYGLEYRALSNFWLNSYQLMSFVMGLCRQAVDMVVGSTKDSNYVKALLDAVPRQDVIRAVQENNFNLAYKNFKKIEPILLAAAGNNGDEDDDIYGEYAYYPISHGIIQSFHYFVSKIKEHGLKYWFNSDALSHWCSLGDGHGKGWESFAANRIRKAMKGKYIPKGERVSPVVAVEA